VKFRDEARPRFGLLRTRELIMCDAYLPSTSTRWPCRRPTAWSTTPTCGSSPACTSTCPRWKPSRAPSAATSTTSSWSLGSGEDHFVRCSGCGYAPTWEAAARGGFGVPEAPPADAAPVVEHHTPERPGIEQVVAFFDDPAVTGADLLKSLAVVDADGRPALVLLAGEPRGPPAQWLAGCSRGGLRHPPDLVKGTSGRWASKPAGITVGPTWA